MAPDEEYSAFTGNLPAVSQHSTDEISPFTGNLPVIAHANTEEFSAFSGNLPLVPGLAPEEFSAFSGNLPTIPKKVVEAALAPAPRAAANRFVAPAPTTPAPAKAPRVGSLWTYADEPPHRDKSSRSSSGPQPGKRASSAESLAVKSGTKRKGGLWSYAANHVSQNHAAPAPPPRSPRSAKQEKGR